MHVLEKPINMKFRIQWILLVLVGVLAGVGVMIGRSSMCESRSWAAEKRIADGRPADVEKMNLLKIIRDQEDRVERGRQVIDIIVRTMNAVQVDLELEQEINNLEHRISGLLKYDGDELMVYAGGLDVPGNVVKDLYPEYQEARRQLDSFKSSGLGDRHPAVMTLVPRIKDLQMQLQEGIGQLRVPLTAQLDRAVQRRTAVRQSRQNVREEYYEYWNGIRFSDSDFKKAKRDLDNDQDILREMYIHLQGLSPAS
jgi:hypothetical protein